MAPLSSPDKRTAAAISQPKQTTPDARDILEAHEGAREEINAMMRQLRLAKSVPVPVKNISGVLFEFARLFNIANPTGSITGRFLENIDGLIRMATVYAMHTTGNEEIAPARPFFPEPRPPETMEELASYRRTLPDDRSQCDVAIRAGLHYALSVQGWLAARRAAPKC